MNPAAQRIAIAEACGWKHCEINHHSTGMFRKGAATGTSPDSERTLHIPSYTTDLNAMHEAEKVLDAVTQRGDYWDYLFSLTGGEFEMCHATAAQRAEAFLRTLGKWEDGK